MSGTTGMTGPAGPWAEGVSFSDWTLPLPGSDIDILAVISLLAGVAICFFAYKFPRIIIIIVGGLFFGTFCWNEIVPNFINDMAVCYVAGCFVSLIGAIVGGVVALLVSWISIGVCSASLIGVAVLLLDGGTLFTGITTCLVLFVVLAVALVTLSYFKEDQAMLLMSSIFGGLLIVYGIDFLLERGLLLNTGVILQLGWPEQMHCYGECHVPLLIAAWAALSVLGLLVQGHLSGKLSLLQLCNRSEPPAAAPKRKDSKPAAAQKTFTYSDNQTYNYFDPNRLPPAFAMHAEMVYVTAELLANYFGFQDDNVRNQAEHAIALLANHRRYADAWPVTSSGDFVPPPATCVHSLHRKLFENYHLWCETMRITPQHMPVREHDVEHQQSEAQAMVLDIMMMLCIWGEGGNLRHMPECLCFLYHNMAKEYMLRESYPVKEEDMPYAGYYLDHVVTPIWEVVVRFHKAKGDHINARNYDDFNEFFWSPACLAYSYRDVSQIMQGNVSVQSPDHGRPGRPAQTPVARALETAPKTFLEKRSMFSAVLTFHRILEFHLITFQACAILSFANILVWDKFFTWQLLSTVLWSLNFLGIIWTLLEVWQAFPGINITGTAKCGFLIRLATRFLILVYQTLYFMWSLDSGTAKRGLQGVGSPVFWWWQYLWLSMVCLVPYAVECLLQVFPPLATYFCTMNNDLAGAFLNITFPLSRLFVGKRVHESLRHAVGYITFWVSLLAWKIYFSYQYEVQILVLPSVELYDDYVNYPGSSLFRCVLLIVVRWIPQLCIYLIDTSIWFATWSAMLGAFVGFQERLGEVRDFPTIREKFMNIPKDFCNKIICPGVSSRDTSMVDLVAAEQSSAHKPLTNGTNVSETSQLLQHTQSGRVSRPVQRYVAEFLDVRTQKWAAFAAVWNEVINQMRLSDTISNAERDMLKFHSFGGFSKPVYLPIFQTAGSLEKATTIILEEAAAHELEEDVVKKQGHETSLHLRIAADITVEEAVSEVWELGIWFLRQLLGPVHDTDIARVEQIVNEYIRSKDALRHLKLEKVKSIVNDATAIISILQNQLPKRKKAATKSEQTQPGQYNAQLHAPSTRPRSDSMKKSISTSGLASLGGKMEVSAPPPSLGSTNRHKNLKIRSRNNHITPDRTRDDVRDKIRPLFQNIKSMVKSVTERNTEILDRLTFVLSLEQGFMWDDTYASSRLDRLAEDKKCVSIMGKLYGLMAMQLNDAEPQSAEAKRRLAFFVNSLFMDMPRSPPVSDMMSWTCVTPFYSEDVLYSRGDLEEKNEDGLTTLMYLQALWKHDWRNFLERMKIQDEQQVWSKKFINDTRLWASLRAQTLSRTVEGMMYYEAALRLLSHLEKVKEDQIEDLVKTKFQYVVACQVYGRMKKSADPKADDIDRLLKRFPNLRVAYIDEVRVTRGGQSEFFSVLIKASHDGLDIEEVFRVKLPGNPVIGEGKPENQNHAMIFTRGEHIQAIDMNQEGYFEEALKQRNLLQEFHARGGPPITIVGFREHIFTGAVSSLANYMALQELSFVTLGQRVLNALRIRMHYGHPDLFDKIFFITRGGVSKASKGINLSEDIFAGYNNCIRGGQVQFKEYVQVGKGRDVGMQQIYKFEAKLSQGAAEQSLSRDTNRLGSRLDFFRLMSFYFGGLGYYIGNYITVAVITFVVYLMLALAVFNSEKIGERKITPEGGLQMMLAGMGLLNTLPMMATIMVEKGMRSSLWEVLQVFISGGPVYFMFHIQTRAHYFYQTLLAGGAQYRATGRGFVTHHSTFDDLYRFFANSHFYLGFDLAASLALMAVFSHAHQYLGRTWSLWLASISFLFAPFWFNPLSFEWGKVAQDYRAWVRWMSGSGGSASNSWEVWWREENSYLAKFSLGQKCQCLVRPFFHLVIGIGIGAPKLFKVKHKEQKGLERVAVVVVVLLVMHYVLTLHGSKFAPWVRRTSRMLISVVVVIGGISLLIANSGFIKVAIGVYYVVAAMASVGTLLGISLVRHAYHIHDFLLGHVMFVVLFILSALQIPSAIQTWLLFHNALSQGVVIEDILKYARHTQEAATADELEDISELKKLVKHQEFTLQQLMRAQGQQYNPPSIQQKPAQVFEEYDDSDGSGSGVPPAQMMRASTSTLTLSEMAHSSSRSSQPPPGTFQFSGPDKFPPRA